MEKQAVLSAKGICKNFGGVIAAEDISFDLYPGEIMGLIGPNGAGKTTLLNMISGIYDCDKGTIHFAGQDITTVPSHDRARLGMARTFQTPRFLSRSNIMDNLLLGTDLGEHVSYWKSFWSKRNKRFESEMEILSQLAHVEIEWDADINGIPYGQRKLLEIIRAMLSHPKALLVDEPAAGLNAKELEHAVALIRYAVQQGVAVILIEHQMDMIMNVCQKILVLNFGRVIGYGTPKEVSANPEVIAAYLGRRKRDA